jgi:general secretion pathway protein G
MQEDRKTKNKKKRKDDGWTFIETLIVIGIVLVLTSSVGFMAVKYLDKAKTVTAKSQIETFSLALDAFYLDMGRYPTASEGLDALWTNPAGNSGNSSSGGWNGPYLNKKPPLDPWGREYEYRYPGYENHPYGVRSYGGDGLEGGEGVNADITSWD